MDRDEFRTIDSAKKEEEWKQVRGRTVPLIEAMRSYVGLQNKRSRSLTGKSRQVGQWSYAISERLTGAPIIQLCQIAVLSASRR